jgi:hypothetical protein
VSHGSFFCGMSGLLQNLVAAGERSMRLLIAERPERGHVRRAGELRVLRHDRCRLARADHEQVERARVGIVRQKPAVARAEIERAVRLVHEETPPARADDPRHRHAAAVRTKLIATLTAACANRRSAPVDLQARLRRGRAGTVAEREAERAALASIDSRCPVRPPR